MKANELMIGDWVRGFVPDSYSTIYGIFNEQRIAIIAEPSKAYIELSIDDIQPIPLTPEILEKNGMRNGYEAYYVSYSKNDESWYFVYDSDSCCLHLLISYVHEFQHALRLCGIEKEIEI